MMSETEAHNPKRYEEMSSVNFLFESWLETRYRNALEHTERSVYSKKRYQFKSLQVDIGNVLKWKETNDRLEGNLYKHVKGWRDSKDTSINDEINILEDFIYSGYECLFLV